MTAAMLVVAFIGGFSLDLPYADMRDCRDDADLLKSDASVVYAECKPVYHMTNARVYVPPKP